jgi:hypothetical protein
VLFQALSCLRTGTLFCGRSPMLSRASKGGQFQALPEGQRDDDDGGGGGDASERSIVWGSGLAGGDGGSGSSSDGSMIIGTSRLRPPPPPPPPSAGGGGGGGEVPFQWEVSPFSERPDAYLPEPRDERYEQLDLEQVRVNSGIILGDGEIEDSHHMLDESHETDYVIYRGTA